MLTMLVYINNNKTMKELIRKVLKESVYGKDLIEKGRVVTAMYNDIEDLLGNRNGFTGNQETGVTSIDDFFWYIIDLVDYKKDDDYRRVKKYLTDLNRLAGVPSNVFKLLSRIIMFKSTALDISSGRGRGIDVSDDSWGDLRVDVISRGKEFYDKAVKSSYVMKKMAEHRDYTESFMYGIPYPNDLM